MAPVAAVDEPVREDAGAPSSPLLHCAVSPLMEPAGSKGLKLRAEFDLTSAEAGELLHLSVNDAFSKTCDQLITIEMSSFDAQ